MLFDGIFKPRRLPAFPLVHLEIGKKSVPLLMVRHPRACRYRLRLHPDGSARVTIPRGGSVTVARQFVERHSAWLERQLQRLQTHPPKPVVWQVGTEILLRGELVRIEAAPDGDGKSIRLGDERIQIIEPTVDLRPAIENHLRELATRELPARLLKLAARHGLSVNRITIRAQKSRWGSCSRRGTISLNWRLIQTPAFVSDYICLHELMHLRQMNHSARFWREVEAVCPEYRTAERWLKERPGLLR